MNKKSMLDFLTMATENIKNGWSNEELVRNFLELHPEEKGYMLKSLKEMYSLSDEKKKPYLQGLIDICNEKETKEEVKSKSSRIFDAIVKAIKAELNSSKEEEQDCTCSDEKVEEDNLSKVTDEFIKEHFFIDEDKTYGLFITYDNCMIVNKDRKLCTFNEDDNRDKLKEETNQDFKITYIKSTLKDLAGVLEKEQPFFYFAKEVLEEYSNWWLDKDWLLQAVNWYLWSNWTAIKKAFIDFCQDFDNKIVINSKSQSNIIEIAEVSKQQDREFEYILIK